MPPSAAWNRPVLSACAPVKLPFLWPKNSLSISSAGIAPQLTGTNGPLARAPSSWMVRATSSLPTPDSPAMYTGAWLRATLAKVVRSSVMAGDWPNRRAATLPAAGEGLPVSLAVRGCEPSFNACCTSPRSTVRSTGLLTKSKAPALSAPTAASWLPKAVIIATGVCGYSWVISCTNSIPEPSARRMSVRHSAYWLWRSRARASCRDEAVSLFSPIRPRVSTNSSRMSRSSSTMRTLLDVLRASVFIRLKDTRLPRCVQVRRFVAVCAGVRFSRC